MAQAPFPPLELAHRVGSLEATADPFAYYDDLGRRAREEIMGALPADWTLEGKTLLDFGCGAGRTLRHFVSDPGPAEIWGCDIDRESIAWLERELSPPLRVFANGPSPPLPLEDSHFDLIWAVSVFTHLVETWSEWILELHRILRPGGLLVATFMGEGMSEIIANEEWREDRVGMNVLRYGQHWDLGGPMVLHSPWWIREHWGRAFEVLNIVPAGFATDSDVGQGLVVLRRREVAIDARELERIDPAEPRELEMLLHNLEQNRAEIRDLRHSNDHLTSEVARHKRLTDDQDRRLSVMLNSRSWSLTEPLRTAGRKLRERRGRPGRG